MEIFSMEYVLVFLIIVVIVCVAIIIYCQIDIKELQSDNRDLKVHLNEGMEELKEVKTRAENDRQFFDKWKKSGEEQLRKETYELANKEYELKLQKWISEKEDEVRKDAAERSRRVVDGKVNEQFSPFLEEFDFDPKDARFLGNPIDFVVFDGLTQTDDIKNIIFVEVKTGKSQLTVRQKKIKDAISEGKIVWKEIRIKK
jgi:predicted Holliday junction resolvase-like endonuclease